MSRTNLFFKVEVEHDPDEQPRADRRAKSAGRFMKVLRRPGGGTVQHHESGES